MKARRMRPRLLAAYGTVTLGPVRRCNCDRDDHAFLKSNPRAFSALPVIGVQPSYSDDEPDLELRNCHCGSTLARPVDKAVAA